MSNLLPSPDQLAILGGDHSLLELLFPISNVGGNHEPYWRREDPFFDPIWDHPPRFAPNVREHRHVDLSGTHLTYVDKPEFHPPGSPQWAATVRRPSIAETLAVIDGFHHLTSKQISAFTSRLAVNQGRHLRPAFDAGLLERGQFQHDTFIPGKLPWLYAIHDGKPISRWARDVGTQTAQRVFGPSGGAHKSGGSAIARHNVTTAEAVLRLCEVQPNWEAITPETQATPQALLGITDPRVPRFTADAVLHRSDGLRVAIETTGSRNLAHIENKMRRWATLLCSQRRDVAGLVVIFLNTHPDLEQHAWLSAGMRRIYVDVTKPGKLRTIGGTLASPDEAHRARGGIQLASWLDWFPIRRTISDAGAQAVAVGSMDAGRTWTISEMADPNSYPYEPARGQPHPIPTREQWAGQPKWVGELPLTFPPAGYNPAFAR